MFVMKGNLDILKKIFCCCRGKPSKMQTEVREIEDIERLLVKQFDLQTIIIKISSLLVNQKRILKRLDINPQLVNLMDLWRVMKAKEQKRLANRGKDDQDEESSDENFYKIEHRLAVTTRRNGQLRIAGLKNDGGGGGGGT